LFWARNRFRGSPPHSTVAVPRPFFLSLLLFWGPSCHLSPTGVFSPPTTIPYLVRHPSVSLPPKSFRVLVRSPQVGAFCLLLLPGGVFTVQGGFFSLEAGGRKHSVAPFSLGFCNWSPKVEAGSLFFPHCSFCLCPSAFPCNFHVRLNVSSFAPQVAPPLSSTPPLYDFGSFLLFTTLPRVFFFFFFVTSHLPLGVFLQAQRLRPILRFLLNVFFTLILFTSFFFSFVLFESRFFLKYFSTGTLNRVFWNVYVSFSFPQAWHPHFLRQP